MEKLGIFIIYLIISLNTVGLPNITLFRSTIQTSASNQKRLVLICKAAGEPLPDIHFQKDGLALRNTTNIQRIDRQTLHINNANHSINDGRYTCVARNTHGIAFKELAVQVPTVGKFKNDGNSVSYERVMVNYSKSLHCPEHTYANPVTYLWGFFNDFGGLKIFARKSNHHLLNDGKQLLFSVVTDDDINTIKDEGGISCFMVVGMDLEVSKRLVLRKVNTGNFQGLPPRLIGKLHYDNTVLEGEDLELHCAAAGNPLPLVQWFKDDVKIVKNDSRKYKFDTECTGKLTLLKVTKDMEGEYKCVAINIGGSDFSKAKLTIAELPRIISFLPNQMHVYNGSKMRLNCNVTGTGPFNYAWYRNGTKLFSYSQENYTMNINQESLEINAVRYEDSGTYQCFIKSNYGQTSYATQVLVRESNATTTKYPDNNKGDNSTTPIDHDSNIIGGLELKYIISIASVSSVFLLVTCCGIFLYCRAKKKENGKKGQTRTSYSKQTSHDNNGYEKSGECTSEPIYQFPGVTNRAASTPPSTLPHVYFEIGTDGKSHVSSSIIS